MFSYMPLVVSDRPWKHRPADALVPVPSRMTRRQILGGLLAASGLGMVGGAVYAGRFEPTWTKITRQTMSLRGLGKEFEGARIIQISDLHVGSGVPLEFLQKWVNWISVQQADWVVVTGDCVNYANAPGTVTVARLLADLRACDGVLVTLGNHDWGASKPRGGSASLAQRTADTISGQGVKILRNQSVTFRRNRSELHFVGLDDFWGERFDPAAAFARVPSVAPTIVLSHNPDSFFDLQAWPCDWVLSGHTHGGQVNIPLFGPPYVPVQHKEFVSGHYLIGGKHLYINCGLGWLRRIRFNARPEVTVFTLERAST